MGLLQLEQRVFAVSNSIESHINAMDKLQSDSGFMKFNSEGKQEMYESKRDAGYSTIKDKLKNFQSYFEMFEKETNRRLQEDVNAYKTNSAQEESSYQLFALRFEQQLRGSLNYKGITFTDNELEKKDGADYMLELYDRTSDPMEKRCIEESGVGILRAGKSNQWKKLQETIKQRQKSRVTSAIADDLLAIEKYASLYGFSKRFFDGLGVPDVQGFNKSEKLFYTWYGMTNAKEKFSYKQIQSALNVNLQ